MRDTDICKSFNGQLAKLSLDDTSASIHSLPLPLLNQILESVVEPREFGKELLAQRQVTRAWLTTYERALENRYNQTRTEEQPYFGAHPIPYELVDSPAPANIEPAKIYLSPIGDSELNYTLKNPKGEIVTGVLVVPFPAIEFLKNEEFILNALVSHISQNVAIEAQRQEINYLVDNKNHILMDELSPVYFSQQKHTDRAKRRKTILIYLTTLQENVLAESVLGFFKREALLNKINMIIIQDNIERAKVTSPTALHCGPHLTRFPKEIITENIAFFSTIFVLSIIDNKIRCLPGEIGKLSALVNLNAARNCLRSLPREIGNLKALRVLDVEKNFLEILPEELGQLSKLEQLYVTSNKLIALPRTIGSLRELRSIYLTSNNLTSLPEEITELSVLEHLCIRDNQLNHLPETLNERVLHPLTKSQVLETQRNTIKQKLTP